MNTCAPTQTIAVMLGLSAVLMVGQAAHGQKVDPRFKAEVLGLTEDGESLRVRLHEPEGMRVKELRGMFRFVGPDGKTLTVGDTVYRHPRYPFNEKPTRVLQNRLQPEDQRLRKLAKTNPDRIEVGYVPLELSFDREVTDRFTRTITREQMSNGVKLLYEVQKGEVAFFGLFSRRWGETWIEPGFGSRFTAEAVETGVQLMVKVLPPEADVFDDNEWSLMMGEHYPGIGGGSAGGGPPSEPEEKRLPIIDTEAPLKLGDAEVHLIPFRVVDGRRDSIILIIAPSRERIKELVRLRPGTRDFDWEAKFHPMSPPKPDAAPATQGSSAR